MITEQKVFHAERVDDLADIGRKLLDKYPDSRIFAFFGTMGAGKTTFIKALCSSLGVKEQVSSPTFSIVNHYVSEDGNSLYHFDFYRINKLEEVYDLGYEHYFFSGNYCFIEWPEKLEALLPGNCIRVEMVDEGGKRSLRF